MACEGGVGTTNPDIAGLGIIVAFAVQAAISIILSVKVWSLQDPAGALVRIPRLRYIRDEKRRTLEKVLATISDIQTVNGIALLVAALAQYRSLDLYHFHIVYDTVNFTAVSFCAALVNLIECDEEGLTVRLIAIGVFSILYLAFSILFGIALQEWDDRVSGRCYITTHISAPGATHPYVDHIYLGVTCLFLFVILIAALPPFWDVEIPYANGFKIRDSTNPQLLGRILAQLLRPSGKYPEYTRRYEKMAKIVHELWEAVVSISRLGMPGSVPGSIRLFVDDTYWDELAQNKKEVAVICPLIFQYPLHLYMVFTMRRWNSKLLDGDSEDAWGFGQIIALVLLAPTLAMCIQTAFKYHRLRRGEFGQQVAVEVSTQTEGPTLQRRRAVSI